MYFAVLASMIHGLTIPGAMEVAQRAKGYNKGLFEWLRKAPWGNPVFSGVFISIIGFGFLGGISGVMMGTEQLNMIIHNTIYVPGHFHATVVVGTTLSFMALTYFLIPVLFKREMINPGLAKWQPYLFGLSMYFFCLVMMGAGTLGVSRRHWDMAFSGAALAYEWPGAAYLMMGLVGIAGIAAIVGGAIYIYVTVGSLLWGKRLDGAPAAKFTPIPRTAPTAVAQSYGSAGFRRAGHLRAGDGVPGVVHPVLLHQLEVPVAGLGPELIQREATHPGRRNQLSTNFHLNLEDHAIRHTLARPAWPHSAGPVQAAHRLHDHGHRTGRHGRHAGRAGAWQMLVLALSVLVASAAPARSTSTSRSTATA
jgi:hypothetical protein